MVAMQVNNTRDAPVRLHAGQSGQWQRRFHDADGNMGPIHTAARPDAEATGVCWGKLGSGELAICRTAQQLQLWRSDYVNHDLGIKSHTVSTRKQWPMFFEDATESIPCNAADSVVIALSEGPEQAAQVAEPPVTSHLADATADRQRSATRLHAISGTSSVTLPATTNAAHSDRSSLPAAASTARPAADPPVEAPVLHKAGTSGTAAAEAGGPAAGLPASAGSTTPKNLRSAASRQSGAALSAALLQPAPGSRVSPRPAEQHPATRHSIAADPTTPTRTAPRAQGADDCPASEGAATPALCRRDINEARPGRQESDVDVCDAPGTDVTESAPPSRQNSAEIQPRISYPAQPSQHGLNNTFVEIALSPQRLSRPARCAP